MIPQPGRKRGFGKGSCRDGRWQQDASALYFISSLWHAWTRCWEPQPGGCGHAGAVTPPPAARPPRGTDTRRGDGAARRAGRQGQGRGPAAELPVPQAKGEEAQHHRDALGRRRSYRCASGTSTALPQRVAEEQGQVQASRTGYCFSRNSAQAQTLLNVTKMLASH